MQDHWLPGFNFNVEEWDAKGAKLRNAGNLPLARTSLSLARAAFAAAIAEKPAGDARRHVPFSSLVPLKPATRRCLGCSASPASDS
jgi:hypothetical protein